MMDEDYYLLTLMAVARELNVFSIQKADVRPDLSGGDASADGSG